MEPGERFVCHLEASDGETPEFCLGEICCGIYTKQSSLPTLLLWLLLLIFFVSPFFYFIVVKNILSNDDENKDNRPSEVEPSSAEDKRWNKKKRQSKKKRQKKKEQTNKSKIDKHVEERNEDDDSTDESIDLSVIKSNSPDTIDSHKKGEPSRTSKPLNNTKRKNVEKLRTERGNSNEKYNEYEEKAKTDKQGSNDDLKDGNNNKQVHSLEKSDEEKEDSFVKPDESLGLQKRISTPNRTVTDKEEHPSDNQNNSLNKNRKYDENEPERKYSSNNSKIDQSVEKIDEEKDSSVKSDESLDFKKRIRTSNRKTSDTKDEPSDNPENFLNEKGEDNKNEPERKYSGNNSKIDQSLKKIDEEKSSSIKSDESLGFKKRIRPPKRKSYDKKDDSLGNQVITESTKGKDGEENESERKKHRDKDTPLKDTISLEKDGNGPKELEKPQSPNKGGRKLSLLSLNSLVKGDRKKSK